MNQALAGEPFFVIGSLINTKMGYLYVWDDLARFGFLPKRQFIISGVGKDEFRGEHAHKLCTQAIYSGESPFWLSWTSRNGISGSTIMNLENGIFVAPPLTWITLSKFESTSSMAIVLASEYYAEDDYIRDKQEFFNIIKTT